LARRLSRPFRTHPRRKTAWEETLGSGSALQSPISSTSIVLAQGFAFTAEELTIARTRGRLSLFLDTATALGGFVGAFGIAVVSSPAFAAGGGSVPTPVTEANWDGWMFWTPIQLVSADAIAGAGVSLAGNQVNSVSAALNIEIDSKAMRKVGNNMTVMAALQVTELGTATMQWLINARQLVMLP